MKRMLMWCAAMLLFVAPALAQDVDEILAKHYEAVGGLDTIKGIESIKLTGTVLIPAQGMEIPFISYNARPMKSRVESTFQGMTMVQAYDGETAWMIMPWTGNTDPQVMPAPQAESFVEQADMDGPLVDYEAKGNKVELLGKEDLEGTDVYKLKVTLKNGNERFYYLDTEYYLPLQATGTTEQMGQKVEVVSSMGDYKEVGGMMMPHSIEQKMNGQTQTQITVETVELGVEAPGDLFMMPAAPAEGAEKEVDDQ